MKTPLDTIRVYVGADQSQALAIRVLEHSIRRYTSGSVVVTPMVDLPVPTPRDPKQRQRTGFSFSRFCIPKLSNYSGRAIYMDADMLVMKDMRLLWDIPMNGHKVLIQRELEAPEATGAKLAAPKKRIKQCAVMMLDCSRLDWKIEEIVQGLDDGKYTYEDLVYQLCLLEPEEIGYDIPFQWNSLEHLDDMTGNIHYTDMPTQPWVSAANPNDGIWLEEVAMMLQNGTLKENELRREIEVGHFRPSLIRDVQWRKHVPAALLPVWRTLMGWSDKLAGYKPHAKVNEANRARISSLSLSGAASAPG